METKSQKRQRFEKVAGKRVNLIISTLNSLANCANRNNYEYSDADVKKMLKALKDKVSEVEQEFGGELSRAQKQEFKF